MPRKVYSQSETEISFKSGTGANIVGFSPMTLPTGSGRISHPRDLGESPRCSLYRWRATTQASGAPTTGNTVDIYWASFDRVTNGVPQMVDGAMASGDLLFAPTSSIYNLQWLGSIVISASGETYQSSGLCQLYPRYGSVVWINRSNATLTPTSGVHEFTLIPTPDEIQ